MTKHGALLLSVAAVSTATVVAACSGRRSPPSCDPPFQPGAAPSGLLLTSDRATIVVPAVWSELVSPCGPGQQIDALHVLPESAAVGTSFVLSSVPSGPRTFAVLTSEFDFVASGSTYETVDLRTGFSASRSLPAAATSIRSVGNTAFFSIVASPYLVMHQPGASDLAISLPAASAGLHPHQNLLFVALQGGGVVEVIATSGTISRQLPSCSPSLQLGGTQIGSGPLVSVGPGTLALACSNSAVDFIDLSTGSSSVLSLPPAAPDPHLITGISGSDAPGATLLLSLTIAQQSFVEFLTSGTANVLDTSNPGIVASDQAVVNAGADSYVTNGSVVQHVHFANRKISGAPILGSGGAETRNGRIAIVSGLATTNGLGVYFLDTASGAVVGQPNVLPAPTGMPP